MKQILLFIILLTVSNISYSLEIMLPNEEQEQRAKNLFGIVRCVTCKGQSIKDSNAEIALLLRKNIRTQMQNGLSDQEILDFLKTRYGEEIILNPGFNNKTIALWLLPLLLFIISLITLLRRVKI